MNKKTPKSDKFLKIYEKYDEFHDCEIQQIKLINSNSTLEMVIKNLEDKLVTIIFSGIQDLDLNDFGKYNIILDISIKKIESDEYKYEVEMCASIGCTLGMKCEEIKIKSI